MGGGLRTTGWGGLRSIGRNGVETEWGDGEENAGKGGTEGTSSVYHESLGGVERRHKEEANNIDLEIDDSNHRPPPHNSFSVSSSHKYTGTEARPPYSTYIAEVTADFSNELNDAEHIVSNVTQALRLWQTTGLGEQAFVGLMYEAKALTRKYQTRPHWDALNNKMAYFYSTLRDLCRNTDDGGE